MECIQVVYTENLHCNLNVGSTQCVQKYNVKSGVPVQCHVYLVVLDNVQDVLPKLCGRLSTVLHTIVQMDFGTFA